MVLSNKGIYFLIPPKKPCSVCPAENFCPVGPTLDFRFEYENVINKKSLTYKFYVNKYQIKFVLNLEGHQRIAFQTMKAIEGGFLKYGVRCCVVFFPKLNSKNVVLNVLNKFDTIHKNIDDDELTIKALEKLVLFI